VWRAHAVMLRRQISLQLLVAEVVHCGRQLLIVSCRSANTVKRRVLRNNSRNKPTSPALADWCLRGIIPASPWRSASPTCTRRSEAFAYHQNLLHLAPCVQNAPAVASFM